MRVERTYNKRAFWWKITYENKASVEVEWAWDHDRVWVLSYGPRGGDRGGATLPLEVLDELITMARDRPDLDADEALSYKDMFELPEREFGEDQKE